MTGDQPLLPIEGELRRLREEWGSFPEYQWREALSRERYERYWQGETDERDEYFYAGAWICHDGRVLLVHHPGAGGWTEPGGTHEPGERLVDTARREAREEAGVDCRITGVNAANVVRLEPAEDVADPIRALIVSFAADYQGGEPRPRDDEISRVRWFSELPDEEDLAYGTLTNYEVA